MSGDFATSRIGDERRALRTDVRVAQIDVGDPGPHLDAAGRGAHELRGRMTSLFTSEDRIEPCFFRFACDRLDFFGTPTNAGNDAECKPFGHGSPPFLLPFQLFVDSLYVGLRAGHVVVFVFVRQLEGAGLHGGVFLVMKKAGPILVAVSPTQKRFGGRT